MGDEEFAIVLSYADADVAEQFAERIGTALAE
jgi:GGDEF domain-containing protein